MDPVLALSALVAVLVVLVVARLVVAHRRKARLEDGFGLLVARDADLGPTSSPGGLLPAQLADTFVATPRGARRFGARYGITGPIEATIGGLVTSLECSAFEWWNERRGNGADSGRSRGGHVEQRTVVAVLRLPRPVPSLIRIVPAPVSDQLGLTHDGHQVESSEFNRQFHVEGGDRDLVVSLLDASVQHLLLEAYPGRSIELLGELLVLGGEPAEPDTSLPGVIGALPAARRDAAQLAASLPAAFWRATEHDRPDLRHR